MNSLLRRYQQLGQDFDPKKCKLKPSLRVNTLSITSRALVKRLRERKISIKKIPFLKEGYWITKTPVSPGATNEYLQGHYYLQEAAAQIPVPILDPKEGETILDMCAAPGGKTTQISQYMNNEGLVIALDSNGARIPGLCNNLSRMHTRNAVVYQKDAQYVNDLKYTYDKILLDAPCSGNFLSEAGWFEKRTLEGIKENAMMQKKLLNAALSTLKDGGILVYSTCSLEPEENELMIDWLLRAHNDVALLDTDLEVGDPGITEIFGKTLHPDIKKTRRLWPHKTGTQGFFIAKMTYSQNKSS